jgi:hypothetical protein
MNARERLYRLHKPGGAAAHISELISESHRGLSMRVDFCHVHALVKYCELLREEVVQLRTEVDQLRGEASK